MSVPPSMRYVRSYPTDLPALAELLPGTPTPVQIINGAHDGLLRALPLADWMKVTIIPLAPHPNDPALVAR